MKRLILNYLSVSFSILGLSCSPLPVVESFGLKAKLSSDDGLLVNRKVDLRTLNRTVQVETDGGGRLELKPQKAIKMNWLGGPAIAAPFTQEFYISISGFQIEKVVYHRLQPTRSTRVGNAIITESDDYVVIDNLQMRQK